jgi:hypothetical protein
MKRGLLALTLVVALCVRTVHAQPTPLGVTYSLSDGSTVTVWDGYATGDPAPDPGTYVFAVSAAVCTSATPDRNVQRMTIRHFDLFFPMQSARPLPGFYGWNDSTILPPQSCYSGWLAFEMPQGRDPLAVNYHEQPCSPNPLIASYPFAIQVCNGPPSGFWNFA